MARAVLTKVAAKGTNVSAGTKVTMTAANVADGNSFVLGTNDELFVRNSGATSHTVSISSFAEPQFGRTGDFTQAIAAGEIWVFGPYTGTGWKQADGSFYVSGDSAELLFGVVSHN